MNAHKVRENRIRRAYARLGLAICRSRARANWNPTKGLYMVYRPWDNWGVDGYNPNGYAFDLDDLELRLQWHQESGYYAKWVRK